MKRGPPPPPNPQSRTVLIRNGVQYTIASVSPKRAGVVVSKRGLVRGMSRKSASNLSTLLAALDLPALLPYPTLWTTLTLLRAPSTAREAHLLIESYLRRLHRLGLVHFVWVREMQPRTTAFGRAWRRAEMVRTGVDPGGVPHWHLIMFFAEGTDLEGVNAIGAWLDISHQYGSTAEHQHSETVRSVVAVAGYQALHGGGRSTKHRQRELGHYPSAWLNSDLSTGLCWNKSQGIPLLPREDLASTAAGAWWQFVFMHSVAIRQAWNAAIKVPGQVRYGLALKVYEHYRDRATWMGLKWLAEDHEFYEEALDAAMQGVVLGIERDIWPEVRREIEEGAAAQKAASVAA